MYRAALSHSFLYADYPETEYMYHLLDSSRGRPRSSGNQIWLNARYPLGAVKF